MSFPSNRISFIDRSPRNHLEWIRQVLAKDFDELDFVLHEFIIRLHDSLSAHLSSGDFNMTYELRQEDGVWFEFLHSNDEFSDSNYLSVIVKHTPVTAETVASRGMSQKVFNAAMDMFDTEIMKSDDIHPMYKDFIGKSVLRAIEQLGDRCNMGVQIDSDNVSVVQFSSLLGDKRLEFIIRPHQVVANEAIWNMNQLRQISHPGGIDHRVQH